MSTAVVEKNLEVRAALAADVQRHIRESMQDWRNTLEIYSSDLNDLKLQVKHKTLSREDALEQVKVMLSTFHEADGKFERYQTDVNFLLDVHEAEAEMTLVTNVQTLVFDWYNLKVLFDSDQILDDDAEDEDINELSFEVEASPVEAEISVPIEVAVVESTPDDVLSFAVEATPVEAEIAVPIEASVVESTPDDTLSFAVEATPVEAEIAVPIEASVVETTPGDELEAITDGYDFLADLLPSSGNISNVDLDANLQLRQSLAGDVRRHIRESVQDWRNTIDKYSSKLQDLKDQVDYGTLTREEALNEIEDLLANFHEADVRFNTYSDHSQYLMEIHKSEVEPALITLFQNLVVDWNNLGINLDSLKNSIEAIVEVTVEEPPAVEEEEPPAVEEEEPPTVTVPCAVEALNNDEDTIQPLEIAAVESSPDFDLMFQNDTGEDIIDTDVKIVNDVHIDASLEAEPVEPEPVQIAVPCAVEALRTEVEDEDVILPLEVAAVESSPDFDLLLNDDDAGKDTEPFLLSDDSGVEVEEHRGQTIPIRDVTRYPSAKPSPESEDEPSIDQPSGGKHGGSGFRMRLFKRFCCCWYCGDECMYYN